MKFLSIRFFITLIAFSSVYRAAENAPRKTQMNDKRASALNCRISTARIWDHSGKAEVSIVVENASQARAGATVVPAFHLRQSNHVNPEWDYSALWDLDQGNLRTSAVTQLQIDAGGHKNAAIDVSGLFWSRANSALLPHSKLFDSVPRGKYLLWLDLTSGEGTVLCSSRKIAVEIK